MQFEPATEEQIEAVRAKSVANPGRSFTYTNAAGNMVWVKNGEETEVEPPAVVEAKAADPSIMEMFGDSGARLVRDITAEVKGVPTIFYIEVLSTREAMKLDGEKYVANGVGKRAYDPAGEELRGIANRLHRCVVQNVGTEEKPDWQPLFTREQIWGADAILRGGKVVKPATAGLLDNPNEDAKAFLMGLDSFVQLYNPSLSPLGQAQALHEQGLI